MSTYACLFYHLELMRKHFHEQKKNTCPYFSRLPSDDPLIEKQRVTLADFVKWTRQCVPVCISKKRTTTLKIYGRGKLKGRRMTEPSTYPNKPSPAPVVPSVAEASVAEASVEAMASRITSATRPRSCVSSKERSPTGPRPIMPPRTGKRKDSGKRALYTTPDSSNMNMVLLMGGAIRGIAISNNGSKAPKVHPVGRSESSKTAL